LCKEKNPPENAPNGKTDFVPLVDEVLS
jgi:hypothetical protein